MKVDWSRVPLAASLIMISLLLAEAIYEYFGMSKAWAVPLALYVVQKMWVIFDTYDISGIRLVRAGSVPARSESKEE
jgi:hypothetical protein